MDAAVGGRRTWFGYEGILAEILKSIVYGGLMEVIASLSIVASAAASDTATCKFSPSHACIILHMYFIFSSA